MEESCKSYVMNLEDKHCLFTLQTLSNIPFRLQSVPVVTGLVTQNNEAPYTEYEYLKEAKVLYGAAKSGV